MHPRFMFCRHVPILTLAILPGGVCATCTHKRFSPRRISNPFPYYSEQHSINSLFLLCVMLLQILLADFVHVNSILDLVKFSAIFNSIHIDPHFPVIRLKDAFELTFWISVHPFFVSEVGMPSFKTLIQAICLLYLAFSGTGQSSRRYRC